MVDPDLDEIVAVYLATVDPTATAAAAADAATVADIGAALGVDGDRVAPRVALLSTLDEMTSRGLVTRRTAADGGTASGGSVYELSADGRALAERTIDRLADREIVVEHEDGERTDVPLSAVDEHVAEPALARALARLSDEGVLSKRETVDEQFVDRETERATLREHLDDVADGSARVGVVRGEAGVGKTELLTEALVPDARDRGFDVFVGRCRPATGEPYGPLREALADRLTAADTDPFDRSGADPDDARAYAAERAAMFESVTELVESGDRPTALVIEDLHLAAEPTAALFDHLARTVEGSVFIVGSARAGVDGPAVPAPLSELVAGDGRGEGERVARIDLAPFDREGTRELIEVTLGRADVPGEFVDAIQERTGGNALFVRETVAEMLDTGALDPAHDIYPRQPSAVGRAEAVESVVVDRLDRLDDTTRRILEAGALLGGEVSPALLASALDEPEPRVRERATVLAAAGLWEHVADGTTVRFRSDLIREVAVDALSDDRRERLHGALAAALEATDDVDHGAAATHRLGAGDDDAALSHLRAAGDRAKATYAHELALTRYESALEVARDRLGHDEESEVVVDVLERVAEVYYLRGEYEEADKYYGYVDERVSDPETGRRIGRIRADMLDSIGRREDALTVAEDAIDRYGIADTHESGLLLGRRGAQRELLGDRDAGLADYDEIEAIGERTGDEHLLAVARLNRGASDLRWHTVDAETVATLRGAVERAEAVEADRTLARALNNLSQANAQLGSHEEAETVLERCLEVRRSIGDRTAIARTKHNLADLYRRGGSFEGALSLHAEAADTAETVGNDVLLAGSQEESAEVLRATGSLEAAQRRLERTVEILDGVGHAPYVASRTAWLASVALDRGDTGRARDLATEAVELATEAEDPLHHAVARGVRGDVHRASGALDAAREDYETGLELLGPVEDPAATASETVLSRGLADVLARRGEFDAARERLADAAATLDEREHADLVADVGVVRARVARLRGDLEAASAAAEAALTDAQEGATRWPVAEVAALLELARVAAERGDDDAVADHCAAASDLIDEHGIGRYEGAPDRIERGEDPGS